MSDVVDFRLIVSRVPGEAKASEFLAVVADAPVERWGREFGSVRVDLESLDRLVNDIAGKWRRSREGQTSQTTERAFTSTERDADLHRVGVDLFNMLFPAGSTTYQLYGETCQYATRARPSMHVRLKLELATELSRFPWELMRPPLTGSYDEAIMQAKRSTVRYLGNIDAHRARDDENDEQKSKQKKPSCVLIVSSDPHDLGSHARVAESFNNEREAIRKLLGRMGYASDLVPRPTLENLKSRIKEFEEKGNSVVGVHFIGHGYHEDKRGSYFCGEDSQGYSHNIHSHELLEALRDANDLQWVILNACWTALEPVACPLAGLATAVSRIRRVPIVIAYNREVETADAEKLAVEFLSAVMEPKNPTFIGTALMSLQARFNNPGGMVVLARSVGGVIPERFALTSSRPDPNASAGQASHPSGASQNSGQPRGNRVPAAAESVSESAKRQSQRMLHIPSGRLKLGFTARQIERLLHQFESHGYPIDREMITKALRDEAERHVDVNEFWVDPTPVTNRQFEEFVEANHGYETLAERRGAPETWRTRASGRPEHPVVFVTYRDAEQFCSWRGGRLPTANEWKWAYRGEREDRLYPWGSDFSLKFCNSAESDCGGTTPVEHYPEGRSDFGCYDMVGNVEEFTSTFSEGRVYIFGGSWCTSCEFFGLPVLYRLASEEFFSNEQGFRCVRDGAPK